MEDRFMNWQDSKKDVHYFGVFDGHAGPVTAHQLQEHMHMLIKDNPNYREGNIRTAIVESFKTMDLSLNQYAKMTRDISGSTAIVVIIDKLNIYCVSKFFITDLEFINMFYIPRLL